MQSTLTIQAGIWVATAAVVGSLALYRRFVSRAEVDAIHLRESESSEIPRQEAMAPLGCHRPVGKDSDHRA
jgi:hypothetical protein